MLSSSQSETLHLDNYSTRKTRSLSLVKESQVYEAGCKGDLKRKGSIQIHDSSPISPSLVHLKRAFSITSSLFRTNSSIIQEKSEDTKQSDALELFSKDMNVDFKGEIWSVTEFTQISSMKKIFSIKRHELGSWNRKTKICLEIGSRYVRETSLAKKTIALIHIKDMKFALTKMGKGYQFTIQGFNHLRELVTRIYKVNTSAELNIWYAQLSEAKSKEYSPREEEQDEFQDQRNDHSLKTTQKSPLLAEPESEPFAIIPNHGYRFWVEFHAYIQRTREAIEEMIDSTMSNMETYEIKEELAELEYHIKEL